LKENIYVHVLLEDKTGKLWLNVKSVSHSFIVRLITSNVKLEIRFLKIIHKYNQKF